MFKKGDKVTLGDLIPGTSFKIPGGETEYMVLAHVEEVAVTREGLREVPFVRCDYVFTLLSADAAWDVIVENPDKFKEMRLTCR